MERPDWDQYFMTMAYLAASRSRDSSTHAGTVIVRPDNTVVSTGYNNPPKGMTIEEVPDTRPEKYFYMEHSERNAIYAAAANEGGVQGCRLYVNFLPCADCARAIIQSGITEVIVHREGQDSFDKASGNTGGEWDASHAATLRILRTASQESIIRWWSGKLWTPTGFFRGTEFTL